MRKLPVLRPRPKQSDAAYYARLWREARAYRVDMARKRWCDYSHQHFDWEGFGDRSWRDRRRHLAVLLKAFRRAQVELSRFRGEYQLFASITPGDSGGDAVYVHTPQPKRDAVSHGAERRAHLATAAATCWAHRHDAVSGVPLRPWVVRHVYDPSEGS